MELNFETGWKYFQDSVGGYSANESDLYIKKISEAIFNLEKDVYKMVAKHENMDVAQLKGFIAEVFAADTFNIDATIKQSSVKAKILESTDFASVDISIGEKDFSSKFYKTADKSALEQAKSFWQRYNEDMALRTRKGTEKISFSEYLRERNINESDINKFDSIYNGQYRLIPKDQLEEAIKFLENKIAKESQTRPELVSKYQETLDMLCDRIKASDGTQSIPLSKADSEKIATLAKDGKFDPKDFGISTETLIGFDEVMQQAMKAGFTSAIISAVLKIAPEIYKSIDMLINKGVIEKEQFKKIGFAALSGTAQGFLYGSISAGLTTVIKSGLLGESIKIVDSSVIGAFAVIVMNTITNSYKFATKKITKGELAHEISKDIFVSSCAIAFGSVTQSITPELPVLGYLLGSFIGSFGGSFLYDTGYSCFMSFCVDSGFSLFGLVEQDYKLPKELLNDIGIKTFDFDKFIPKKFEYKKYKMKKISFNKYEYNTIEYTVLNRSVLGINKIGYIVK